MRNKQIWIWVMAIFVTTSCEKGGSLGDFGGDVSLETLADSASYAVGMSLGSNPGLNKVELNYAALIQGIQDIKSGDETIFTLQEADGVFRALEQGIIAEKMKANEAFFEENGTKEGVVTLPSGLQYKVLQEGSGNSPLTSDKVKVHYKGTLLDGRQFDSSYDRGTPTEFGVTQVIRGWTEALQLMKPGSKWILYVPSELGYGRRGAQGSIIGPDEALIFEMELIEIL